MRSNLSTGLDTAKGLAVAWQVPMVGVNHMQAHALTPRLISALDEGNSPSIEPAFPFLSLLVSGGHTLLLHSKDLVNHEILAATSDIAIGDVIDKIARTIVPQNIMDQSTDMMYGRVLEKFAFPLGADDFNYIAPSSRHEELLRKPSKWGWAFGPPLAEVKSGSRSKGMEFSFSGIGSSARRFVEQSGRDITLEERIDIAREAMRVSFEHLASRVIMALNQRRPPSKPGTHSITTLVVSGGVASNQYLKSVLRSILDARGFRGVRLLFPPPSFCTDNAAMIAWAGSEMYHAGWETKVSCHALRKWSLDPEADDGGILGIPDWKRRSNGK
ncbi:MAG: hypothetical protein M1827_000885 [Pycnora praestabilis]|nr:MAG: hypothetical protein M1827_000885 [Pycnora praestabilis]